MQRASFSPLAVEDPDIFAVRVEGPLGARQRAAVEALVGRCREKNKSKIVFDFSGLTSMGGAVATVIAAFARELIHKGHPPQFVGASDVVQTFLTGQCEGFTPSFVASIDEAVQLLQGAIAESEIPTPVAQPAAGEIEAAQDSEAPIEPRLAERKYFSLEEAESWLGKAKTPGEKKIALTGLLFGADLADSCFLFHDDGKQYLDTEDFALSLPREGSVANALRERRGPIPIVDLVDSQLSDAETDLLTRLNCQMVVPILRDGELEALLFLRKRLAGQEYDPGEVLALDLLVRYIAGGGAAAQKQVAPDQQAEEQQPAAATDSRELKQKIYRQQTLARVSRELNSIQDEEHVLNILLMTLVSEMVAGAVVFYDVDGEKLRPRSARGLELSELKQLDLPEQRATENWDQVLVNGRDAGSKSLQKLQKECGELGLPLVAPLRVSEKLLGVVAMGKFRGGDANSVDLDYLTALLQHAGVAVMNTHAFRDLHQQTLSVARTIMGLAERRVGWEQEVDGDRVTDLVTRIARAMNVAAEDMRDLIYGTVLRDIGMIEISDVVLRSPRKLSPEEWKLVQRHPVRGAEILRDLGFGEHACEIVLHHHERFNGEGYPNALRGTAIPVGSRILSVVESYLAMTRDLPYRAALSKQEAIEVLRENWEMRYDPEVVASFVMILEQEPD